MKKNLKANKWLWIISALLAVVVGFLIIPKDGHDFEVDGINYKVVNDISNNVAVTYKDGHDFEVDGINYKVVNDISNIVAVTYKGDSDDAYADEYAGAVVIPDNITYRGINYTVEQIDHGAFRDCSKMTSITIPQSVRLFGISAFGGCSGLKEVHISDLSAWCELSFNDVLDDAGDSPLKYADGLYLNGELITDLIIPEDVTEIGAHSFEGYKNLRSVVFHKGISAIHKSAFFNCANLTDVSFTDEVEYIGPYAFKYTPWYENKSDGEVYIGNVLYKYKGEMPSNTSIVIKDGTETICQSAFDCYENLTSITLPSSLKVIHNYAFNGCNNLKEVYCKSLTPPSINSYYNNFHKDAVIYVPKGTREAYRNESSLFENVVEVDFDN